MYTYIKGRCERVREKNDIFVYFTREGNIMHIRVESCIIPIYDLAIYTIYMYNVYGNSTKPDGTQTRASPTCPTRIIFNDDGSLISRQCDFFNFNIQRKIQGKDGQLETINKIFTSNNKLDIKLYIYKYLICLIKK